MKAISIRGIARNRGTNAFLLTLREDDEPRRQFDIFVGAHEGSVIAMLLEGTAAPRPLTHDLFVLSLEQTGVEIVRTVITHVRDGTYYADLVLRGPSGEESVSCRPSDGLALALRANTPVYAEESLLAEVGETSAVPDEGEILEEFRDFIENINPDDFNQ